MNATATTSVRVPIQEYRILVEYAEKTGRKLQFVLAKAIREYCEKAKR
jgi:predicted DNA-binding protein